MLPLTSTLFQDVPYDNKCHHDEGYKIAHVATTALGHHRIDPSKSTSQQTPSIEHLPLHSTYQVVLTSNLYSEHGPIGKQHGRRVSISSRPLVRETGKDNKPAHDASLLRITRRQDRAVKHRDRDEQGQG